MIWNQNETGRMGISDWGIRIGDIGMRIEQRSAIRDPQSQIRDPQSAIRNPQSPIRNAKSGFTLTELLVVITIIGILTALVAGAAVNALNRAKEAAITLEMQQMAAEIENLRNEYGAYPPNVFRQGDITNVSPIFEQNRNVNQLVKFMRKSFPRSTEFNTSAAVTTSDNNIAAISLSGLTPAEALVFWLQGFSDDITRPLTGTDLDVQVVDDPNNTPGFDETQVITIDSFKPRFDFDRTRLQESLDPGGTRRFLTVHRVNPANPASPFQLHIQLYEYLPSGSQEPYVYFDVSRETPLEVVNNWDTTEFFYQNPQDASQRIYPLKQLRADAPNPLPPATAARPLLSFVEYVEKDKFQILHSGLDDAWGNFSRQSSGGAGGELAVESTNGQNMVPTLLAPEGPFIGDMADTLAHFMTGTLEDKQNEN